MGKKDTDFQRILYKLMVSWLEFAVSLLRSMLSQEQENTLK